MGWKFSSKAAILVADEGGNYGVAPTLDASNYGGLVIYDPQIRPAADTIQRNPVRDSFTPVAPLVGRKSVQIDFATELKGCNDSAAPETETVLHKLLKACAMKDFSWDWGDGTSCSKIWWCELSNADNAHEMRPFQSVWLVEDSGGTPTNRKAVVVGLLRRKDSDGDTSTYDCAILALADDTGLDKTKTQEINADSSGSPGALIATVRVSSGNAVMNKGSALMPTSDYAAYHAQSVTIASFYDDILHLAPGGIGTFNFQFQDGNVPRINFTIYGLWNDPSMNAVPSGVSLFDHLPPNVCKEDLILAQQSGDTLTNVYKPNFSRFSLDISNTVTPDKNLNATECAGEFFINGRSPRAGVDPAVDDLSVFNPWAAWSAGSERVLTLNIGYANVGNRVALTIPNAVYSGLSYTDRDGRVTYQMEITPSGSNDDEFVMIFG